MEKKKKARNASSKYLRAGRDLELLSERRTGSQTLFLFRFGREATQRSAEGSGDEGEAHETDHHAEAENEHQGRVPAVAPVGAKKG